MSIVAQWYDEATSPRDPYDLGRPQPDGGEQAEGPQLSGYASAA